MNGIFAKNGISLERLQSLEKVVRAGSITRVAQGDTNVQSQLSKQITDLEKTLGLQLLDRTRKPHPPTEAARRLADACGCFVREVEEVVAAASGLRRPITVGAGEVVIREFLIPKIGRQKKGKEPVRWVMRNLQRENTWAARTQKLPGLGAYKREFQLGWNRKVAERRPEVAALVKALGGKAVTLG